MSRNAYTNTSASGESRTLENTWDIFEGIYSA